MSAWCRLIAVGIAIASGSAAFGDEILNVQQAVNQWLARADDAGAAKNGVDSAKSAMIVNTPQAEALLLAALQMGLPSAYKVNVEKSHYELYKAQKSASPSSVDPLQHAKADVVEMETHQKLRAIKGLGFVGGTRSIPVLRNLLRFKELDDALREALSMIADRRDMTRKKSNRRTDTGSTPAGNTVYPF